jgi:hypothetical protein
MVPRPRRRWIPFLALLVCFGCLLNSPESRADPQDPSDLYNSFGPAIFRVDVVPANDPSHPVQVGTATVVDQRGYFVTASHIFDGFQPDNSDCSKVAPFHGQLLLVNEQGTKISAHEVLGAPNGTFDFSIIQADAGQDVSKLNLVGLPDLALGAFVFLQPQPTSAQLLAYGYLSTDPGGFNETITRFPMGSLTVPAVGKPLFLKIAMAYHGQSGGPAFGNVGNATILGVLSGINPGGQCKTPGVDVDIDQSNPGPVPYVFSPLWTTTAVCIWSKIPVGDEATKLVDLLKGGNIDTQLAQDIAQGKLRTLPLLQAAWRLGARDPCQPGFHPLTAERPATQSDGSRIILVQQLMDIANRDGLPDVLTVLAQACPSGTISDCAGKADGFYSDFTNRVLALPAGATAPERQVLATQLDFLFPSHQDASNWSPAAKTARANGLALAYLVRSTTQSGADRIASLNQSIQANPKIALAHYELSQAYSEVGNNTASRQEALTFIRGKAFSQSKFGDFAANAALGKLSNAQIQEMAHTLAQTQEQAHGGAL